MLKQGMHPSEIEKVLGQEMSNLATTGTAGDYLNSPPPDNSEIFNNPICATEMSIVSVHEISQSLSHMEADGLLGLAPSIGYSYGAE